MRSNVRARGCVASVMVTLLAFSSGGCATRTASTKVAGERIVTQNFKWVYVTGSHIPVAVPLDANVQAPPGVSPLTVLTPEQIRHLGGPLH
jgi:hypothetical protein